MNRTKRIKICSVFSDWGNILKSIPQGSILGLLLFNIFINDLFFSGKCESCYFADENSLHSCVMNLNNMFTNLIQNAYNVHEWFVCSSIKVSPDKFQFIILRDTDSQALQIGDI